jgi:hypothetical protein
MGDSENMRGSTKSSDEKNSLEDIAWTTSPANVTGFLSKKLLAWGVEERGAYRISTSEPDRF